MRLSMPINLEQRPPELVEVGVGLEPDEVRAQHTPQHRLALGEHPEDARVRERHVEEEADRRSGRRRPDELRDEQQLEVVDPDEARGSRRAAIPAAKRSFAAR